ncbi:MAG TPA: Flp pilus assembly protein CpaB [Longimicrobiales bacterium]
MRRIRLWVVLLLALGSGALAGYLALEYLQQQATPLIAAEPRRNQIVVAARDLEVGEPVRAEDVKVIEWPGDALPPGYASSPSEVLGRGVITPIRVNEPLLVTKLADKEAGAGLSIVIPEGMRALSVRVDEVTAVAGFVGAGKRVDVLVTLTNRGSEGSYTRTVLQNVPVLAAGQQVQDVDGRPQTVSVMTLLVTPQQAEVLALASVEGRIQLALRNTLDVGEVTTTGARVAQLLGSGTTPKRTGRPVAVRPRRPARPEPEPNVIEIYKGSSKTLITF